MLINSQYFFWFDYILYGTVLVDDVSQIILEFCCQAGPVYWCKTVLWGVDTGTGN